MDPPFRAPLKKPSLCGSLISFYVRLLASWASTRPFLLSADLGLYKRRRDSPPSQTLASFDERKESTPSRVTTQGRCPTGLAAGAAAFQPPLVASSQSTPPTAASAATATLYCRRRPTAMPQPPPPDHPRHRPNPCRRTQPPTCTNHPPALTACAHRPPARLPTPTTRFALVASMFGIQGEILINFLQ